MPGRNVNAYQTEHDLLREMLRRFLVAEVRSSRDAGQCGRVVCGAVAALDSLLAAHPVDRRGRCWSCLRPGWLGCRPRVCLVFRKAHYWLRQPTHRVQAQLTAELGVDVAAPSGAADLDAAEVLSGVEPDLSGPPADPLQTPAIPPTPRFQAGWPDQDHGGVGEHPEHPWPGRGPYEDRSAGPGRSLLLTEGNPRVAR